MKSSSHTSPSKSSLAVPSTQNTAPINEFRCLYTHDLRRKQKRWQDGFLRFHTFNKRIMVYDLARNFIGDTHWRQDEEVADGEELELEKGVLVQVQEEVGRVEQDLTGLFEKKLQNRAQRLNQALPGSGPPSVSRPRALPVSATPSTPLRRDTRSLAPLSQLWGSGVNSQLGAVRRPYGRASFPTQSPFEEKRQQQSPQSSISPTSERASKRQRVDDHRPMGVNQPDRSNDRVRTTVHPTVPAAQPRNIPAQTRPAVPTGNPSVRAPSHAIQNIQRALPPATVARNPPRPWQASVEPPRVPEPPSSPPVSTANHMSARDTSSDKHDHIIPQEPKETDPTEQAQTSLCIASKPARRKLISQARPPRNARSVPASTEEPLDELNDYCRKQRARLEARLRPERHDHMTNNGAPNNQSLADARPRPRITTTQAKAAYNAEDGGHDTTKPTAAPSTGAEDAFTMGASTQLAIAAVTWPKVQAEDPSLVYTGLDQRLLAQNPPSAARRVESPIRRAQSDAVNINRLAPAVRRERHLQKQISAPPVLPGERSVAGVGEAAQETPEDIGPWSREAFDLFDWHPPGRDNHAAEISGIG